MGFDIGVNSFSKGLGNKGKLLRRLCVHTSCRDHPEVAINRDEILAEYL